MKEVCNGTQRLNRFTFIDFSSVNSFPSKILRVLLVLVQGSLSRALGLKLRSDVREREREREEADAALRISSPSTSSETSSLVSCRPDSPQSAVVRRRPRHSHPRHRRVKSIGDITVTPV